jgi:hypothetical protein
LTIRILSTIEMVAHALSVSRAAHVTPVGDACA